MFWPAIVGISLTPRSAFESSPPDRPGQSELLRNVAGPPIKTIPLIASFGHPPCDCHAWTIRTLLHVGFGRTNAGGRGVFQLNSYRSHLVEYARMFTSTTKFCALADRLFQISHSFQPTGPVGPLRSVREKSTCDFATSHSFNTS